ncbi:MAG: OmpA family protein [Bacteroidetes bacterium]|nr:MAG: OmpA family protein [Bacteroidota bacterium]
MIFAQRKMGSTPLVISDMRILIILLLFPTLIFAQLKAKIADDHYSRMEYAECAEMYNELANKFLKEETKIESDWEYVRRAAISNYKLFEMKKASGYFDQLKSSNKLTEADRTLFIQATRYLGDYKKCYQLALEGSNLHSSNSFFKELARDDRSLELLFEDSTRIRLNKLNINSDMGDFGPSINGKDLYYVTKSSNTRTFNTRYGWDNDYFLNIRQAKLSSDSTVEDPRLMKNEFLTKFHDGPVSFSSDGKMMIITRNREEKDKGEMIKHLAIYFSELVNGEWSEPKPFQFNSPKYNTGHAVFAENDQAIYFVSDMDGGYGGADIYVSRKQKNGEWGVPVNIGPTVNTSQQELFPFVLNETLYFSSNGHFGLGGLDVYSYSLGRGEKPRNLGYPLNTSYDDFSLVVDATGVNGFVASNRTDNVDRLYNVKILPISVFLQGIVYAQYVEKESIANHPVVLMDETSGITDTLYTNEFGQFQADIEKNRTYRLLTSKEDYILLHEGMFKTENLKKDSTFFVELPLKPTTIQVRLRVVEMGTGKIIPYAKTTVTDYSNNSESVLYTDETGIVTIKVDRNKSYWAHASKKGFVDDNVAFNSSNENDKLIDLELKLPPIVKGDKFKLENIFYDLNKATLRPESKLALDKLADFIIKNELKIELSSHTDARGSDAYNLKLSQARAQSCVDYLITKGVKKNQIVAKGYGETQLINKCKNGVECPEDLHQENRRTEVKIL